MGSSHINALQDTIIHLQKPRMKRWRRYIKRVKQEEKSRETNDEKLDKLMTISNHKKTKEKVKQFHLTAVISRTITYPDKKNW